MNHFPVRRFGASPDGWPCLLPYALVCTSSCYGNVSRVTIERGLFGVPYTLVWYEQKITGLVTGEAQWGVFRPLFESLFESQIEHARGDFPV